MNAADFRLKQMIPTIRLHSALLFICKMRIVHMQQGIICQNSTRKNFLSSFKCITIEDNLSRIWKGWMLVSGCGNEYLLSECHFCEQVL
ncbi:hypothetical protein Tcan_08676 [Toxocara canis]|uniref:Uncharacterized protein n=1 Tax=Toxocara canis TaxID=6265 RepID=A0A0B2VWD1_TOXCA|nr:hypothetical protein Tcan_08676 [Toxocara canis]